MSVESNREETSLDAKKKRKRRKKLLSDIHDQLEFYFSDANLRKDRFLKQRIEADENRYVDISVLLSFNKLKMLTSDPELVARSVKKSNFLQVSEDNKKLRRIHPLMPPKYNIDDVTVYVECLPKTADHSWLQKVFGCCGKVTYISIPRYKSTGDIKGFSFIEFEKPEEAKKACKLLNNPPPNATSKPGKFPKMRKGKTISLDSNPEPYHLQRHRQVIEQKTINEEEKREKEADLENEEPDVRKKKKRKKSHEENLNGEKTDAKQKKKTKKHKSVDKKLLEEEKRNEQESDGKNLKKQKAKKRKYDDDEEKETIRKKKKCNDDSEGDDDANDDEKLKKKRKRKKKISKLKGGCQYHLRVIPKKEWLQLKQEYINLQKQSKKQLKHNVMEMELQQKTAIRACPQKDDVHEAKSKEPEFTPDTVIRLISKESIPSRKKLREHLETMAAIAYLDLEDGDTKGFLRVKTSQGASDVINRLKIEDEMSAELLTGDEEKEYWKKLKADRIARLASKTKGKKKRGADRLMNRAERVLTVASRSHIKFED